MSEIKKIIEDAFDNRDQINTQTNGEIRNSVDETLNQLDAGEIRAVSYTHLTLPTILLV